MFYGYGPSTRLGGLTVSRPVFKRVEQIDAPAGAVVTLATIKSHLRVTHSEEDAYISTLIDTATQAAEMYTNRKLLPRTVKMWMDFIPGRGGSLWIDGSVQAPIGYFGGSTYRYFELIDRYLPRDSMSVMSLIFQSTPSHFRRFCVLMSLRCQVTNVFID